MILSLFDVEKHEGYFHISLLSIKLSSWHSDRSLISFTTCSFKRAREWNIDLLFLDVTPGYDYIN